MTVVIGLDIATVTGYAVLTEEGIIEYGTIEVNSGDPYKRRFKDFRKQLVSLIRTHKPKAITLEGVYTGKNPKISAYLNNLRGIAIETVPVKSKFLSGAVKSVRLDVLGSGAASKNDVFTWAESTYKLKGLNVKKDHDITDAILLAHWGLLTLTRLEE
jgi:Holliday junction resolvasome RuvABC endonuclease subunit